jgi:hypothetical protein
VNSGFLEYDAALPMGFASVLHSGIIVGWPEISPAVVTTFHQYYMLRKLLGKR